MRTEAPLSSEDDEPPHIEALLRRLAWREVEDVLMGATILGCGGGGPLAYGTDLMRRLYDDGGAVTIAAARDVDGDTVAACPYGVGAMTAADEDPYGDRPPATEHPSVLAVRALGDHVGRDVGALLCGELGGSSVADAFYPAGVLGIPVIDADPVGRAVPEIQHSMFAINGAPIAPLAVVNAIGDTVILTSVADDQRAEALIRAMAVASRNEVWVADHALAWRDLRDIAITGTLSLAERVGRAQRVACQEQVDAALAVAAAAEGVVVFAGTVSASTWRDADGFTIGETAIDGTGEFASSSYRVWFKNENLMAWRDGRPDVTCPDLICILDRETGVPLTNPEVAEGARVSVLGLPSPAVWRSLEGIVSLGPAHFGFVDEFVPIEVRHAHEVEGAPPDLLARQDSNLD